MDTKVLSSGVQYSNLPESYIRPESERPRLSEVSECEDVPIIDLGSQNRAQIVHQIGEACRNYGFFQVLSPGFELFEHVLNFFINHYLYLYKKKKKRRRSLRLILNKLKQVINHGVALEAAKEMEEVAHGFFKLPVEEKLKLYSEDTSKTMRLSTSFNVKKETVRNWRDYLRLHCYPLEKYAPEWPSNPPSFK